MSASRLAALAAENLRRDRASAALSALGVAVGVGALCFFVALGLGISSVVRTKVFPVDARSLEVVPAQISLGALLGGGTLDGPALERLRALPGARAAWPKMALRVPAITRYDGSFFGSRLNMAVEIVMVGVDPHLVEEAVPAERFQDPGEGGAIPAVASPRLLEIYNKSFAPSRHLPRLSPTLLTGFEFPVEVGVSYVTRADAGPRVATRAQVAGFSDHAMLAGLTVPLATVRRLNARFGQDASTYSAVTLQAQSPDDVPGLAQAVRGMGFAIDDEDRQRAEQAGAAVAVVTSALSLLAVLICVLAAVNIGQTLFAALRARAREVGVMRAVGATRSQIAAMVLLEAAQVGLLGGLVGTAAARLLALGVDALARRTLPELPFQPDTFFSFPLWLLAAGVGLGLLSAVLGALLPARAAAQLDPARVLAG
jgi:ABC-type antimicrobial peptide transport system permease subunit